MEIQHYCRVIKKRACTRSDTRPALFMLALSHESIFDSTTTGKVLSLKWGVTILPVPGSAEQMIGKLQVSTFQYKNNPKSSSLDCFYSITFQALASVQGLQYYYLPSCNVDGRKATFVRHPYLLPGQ